MIITSKQNPTVKDLVALRTRRNRERAGVTLVDGFEEIQCALACHVPVNTLYYCPELMSGGQQQRVLTELLQQGVEGVELARPVFEKVAYRQGPDGWLAVVPAPGKLLTELALPPAPLVLVCEAIEKPGNLGAMLRTADAVGAHAIISVDGVTDWGNPNIVRASKGAVFAVPVVNASMAEVIPWLRANAITIVASTPDAAMLYTQTDLTKGVALGVGSEKYGHSPEWLQQADVRVRIPMVGTVDSLNVATSAALLMYEALRQRTQ